MQDYEAFRALAYEYDRHRDRLGPILREQLDKAAAITTDQYDEARRTTRRARQTFADLMAEDRRHPHAVGPGAAPHGLGATGKPTFNRLWTLLGPPCVNVPGLSDGSGLPLGVQIVGRFARDKVALAAARFVENALARGSSVNPLSGTRILAYSCKCCMSKIEVCSQPNPVVQMVISYCYGR